MDRSQGVERRRCQRHRRGFTTPRAVHVAGRSPATLAVPGAKWRHRRGSPTPHGGVCRWRSPSLREVPGAKLKVRPRGVGHRDRKEANSGRGESGASKGERLELPRDPNRKLSPSLPFACAPRPSLDFTCGDTRVRLRDLYSGPARVRPVLWLSFLTLHRRAAEAPRRGGSKSVATEQEALLPTPWDLFPPGRIRPTERGNPAQKGRKSYRVPSIWPPRSDLVDPPRPVSCA